MPEQCTGRKLKVNHSTPIPRYILAVDTNPRKRMIDNEGMHIRDTFDYGHLFSGRIHRGQLGCVTDTPFTTKHDFWQCVYAASGSRHTLWVVGHNILYHLTLLGIQTEIQRSVMVLDRPRRTRKVNEQAGKDEQFSGICCLEGPPTILGVRCTRTQGRIIFVDIQNYFAGSVYELSATYRRDPDSSWCHYGPNGVNVGGTKAKAEIVFRTFTDLALWVKAKDFGVFKYTAAGQSMNCFRHKYMKHAILIHDNMDVKKLERRAYFGGRTEVFKHGRIDETVYQYDVNALYPYVMANAQYPKSLQRYELNANCDSLPSDIDAKFCIADVTIDGLPSCFPTRHSRGIIYPSGCFRTVLAGQELQAASDSHGIKLVHAWAVYDCDHIFTAFVKELWQLRQEYQQLGQRQYAKFVKMLMNSLYGKFGQKRPRWEDTDKQPAPMAWAQWPVTHCGSAEVVWHRSVGWSVQRKLVDVESDASFVAIPAFVTAAARCYMNTIREKAGVNNVYYQGTDSIITNIQGSERLGQLGIVDAGQLGLLKLECVGNFAEIFGASDYRIGDKNIISGRKPAGQYISECELTQRKRAGQAALFQGVAIDYSDELILPWERKGGYAKGTVGPDGWVQPIICGGDSADSSVSARLS